MISGAAPAELGAQHHPSPADQARPEKILHHREVTTMYRSILIPTDGSELAGKAVVDGIALAKAIGAKVTILTVTRPFHVVTTDPSMLTDTPAQYETHM